MSPLLWEQGAAGPRSGNYPSLRMRNRWASASRTRLRRRPHHLPLQTPSSTTAPTSALVAVSAGMTVSLPSSPSSGLSSCQFMIIRVVAGNSGSGTYSVIGDCDLLQTTGNGPQSSGGQRSPRRKSTSSTAVMADDGYEVGRIRRPLRQ